MADIILYFSRTGENYVSGTIRNLTKGNTEIAAEMVQKLTGADLFKIEPVVKYSKNYNECIEEAREEQRRDARPELAVWPENLEQYNNVYLGFPNYWGTMPMPVFTLLERYEFAGKTILPFCTHEGSGMGQSERDIKRLCPGAVVKKGLAVHGAKVQDAKKDIEKWLEKNGGIDYGYGTDE